MKEKIDKLNFIKNYNLHTVNRMTKKAIQTVIKFANHIYVKELSKLSNKKKYPIMV